MQKMLATPMGIQIQLTFWKMMVMLAEFALEHRKAVQLIIRYSPVILYGTVAYVLGIAAGKILQMMIF